MKIVVCVKQTVAGELNPFDACAYEAALQIPNAEVILLSMGPEKSKDFLLNLTRLGAREAYLLCDRAFAGADTLATSYALSLAIQKLQLLLRKFPMSSLQLVLALIQTYKETLAFLFAALTLQKFHQ